MFNSYFELFGHNQRVDIPAPWFTSGIALSKNNDLKTSFASQKPALSLASRIS